LGEVLNLTKTFRRFVVYHEQLPAGRRASSIHSHSSKEELVIVLSGAPRVYIDGTFYDLAPGDYVAFEPAAGIAHYIVNDCSDVTAEYFAIASVDDSDVVTYQR
jgi:uncharacterized cupin superfamily protein